MVVIWIVVHVRYSSGPEMVLGPVRLFSEATCILVSAMNEKANKG